MNVRDAKALRAAPLKTPTDLKSNAIRELSGALNLLLADMFGLYVKTKNFHWHKSGPHFRDYHLLLDRTGRSNLCYYRRNRRACAQDRRDDDTLDRPHRPFAARSRQ